MESTDKPNSSPLRYHATVVPSSIFVWIYADKVKVVLENAGETWETLLFCITPFWKSDCSDEDKWHWFVKELKDKLLSEVSDSRRLRAIGIDAPIVEKLLDRVTHTISRYKLAKLSWLLPGITVKVLPPCIKPFGCYKDQETEYIREIVMHLNDYHKWSRNKIADWLEELQESGIDLEFK